MNNYKELNERLDAIIDNKKTLMINELKVEVLRCEKMAITLEMDMLSSNNNDLRNKLLKQLEVVNNKIEEIL